MAMTLTPQRPLASFLLSPYVLAKLDSARFQTVADLYGIKPSQLSKEVGLTLEEAVEVVKVVGGEGERQGSSRSALELASLEQGLGRVVSYCARLDDALGGGVALRQVTEVCGAPGVGKTQLSIQLAVDVCIPEALGGVDGEAVYIDTEGSFIVERVADIATATADHCRKLASRCGGQDDADVANFTAEHIMDRIHYFRCFDYVELLATLHMLTTFIHNHPKVKLVVVDSIACPFRHSFEDLSLRTRLLTSMAQTCMQLATSFSLAVVLTNQMTTRFRPGSGDSLLVPALGESWGHACTVRLVLFWQDSRRHATIYKSPAHREATVQFQITMGGVRDVVSHEADQREDQMTSSSMSRETNPPSPKRQKIE